MYVFKPSKFVIMSLLLLTVALLVGTVSNESVNNAVTPAPQLPPAHSHDIIIDHSDLPTKFGDEDDVIEGKNIAEKKTADHIGTGSSTSNGGMLRIFSQ